MPVSRLESVRNKRIKWLKSLRERKYRRLYQSFFVEGEHCVQEAANSALPFSVLLIDELQQDRFSGLLRQYATETEVFLVPRGILNCLCETVTPQGVAGVLPLVVKGPPSSYNGRLFVALDGIQDPGNLGTILRTADAAGADFLLLSDSCADPQGGKAVRASMGSLFHLPVYQTSDLPGEVQRLIADGWDVCSAELQGDPFFLRNKSTERQGLVIGSEGSGISSEVSAACSQHLRLPMAGKAESLNAAVAAGIMIYDIAINLGILH